MSLLNEINAKLQQFQNVRYEMAGNSISVFPVTEDGFEVSLYIGRSGPEPEFTVFFNGWHEEFSSTVEALNCFAMGLTADCRLIEWSRGAKAYKWTLEIQQDGERETYSTTALFSARYWMPRKKRYLQNNLVK